jgi:hypothetical protein
MSMYQQQQHQHQQQQHQQQHQQHSQQNSMLSPNMRTDTSMNPASLRCMCKE